MKLKLLRETLLLTIFLHYKVRKNQKMTKGPSFETTRGFLTWRYPLDGECHIYVVFWTVLVLAIFWLLPVAFRT